MIEVSYAGGMLPEQGTLVVLARADGKLDGVAAEMDGRSGGLVGRALHAEGDRLKHGRIVDLRLPAGLELDLLTLVAVGKEKPLTTLDLQTLGGKIAAHLKGNRSASIAVAPASGVDLGTDAASATVAMATGLQLRSYGFDRYKSAASEADESPFPAHVKFLVEEPDAVAKLAPAGTATVEGVRHCRDVVSEPANVLYPETFAERCRDLETLGVVVEVLDEAELSKLGMNALLGVAMGSVRAPSVVVMRWSGGAEDTAPVAFIGKGVCFDTGGISIKPAGGMEEMKWDMGGAGAVYGVMRTLALRKAPANVVGVLGLVENMPSGNAQRPGDVVTTMAGVTVEVINTDAEGRLVLADVCWYAQDRFKPRAMIDLATLTGAILVALGKERAGLYANDDTLAESLLAAGETTGERLWRMPLGAEYTKHIKSEIADIKNVGRAREAGGSAGAVFIEKFVNGVPWAHLDVAGTVWSSRDSALAAKGATGFGTRLLDQLVRDRFED